jgi:hypothetical protein
MRVSIHDQPPPKRALGAGANGSRTPGIDEGRRHTLRAQGCAESLIFIPLSGIWPTARPAENCRFYNIFNALIYFPPALLVLSTRQAVGDYHREIGMRKNNPH